MRTCGRPRPFMGSPSVSKDSDFRETSFLQGPPPKVIWIQRGNRTTDEILRLLDESQTEISTSLKDPKATVLELP